PPTRSAVPYTPLFRSYGRRHYKDSACRRASGLGNDSSALGKDRGAPCWSRCAARLLVGCAPRTACTDALLSFRQAFGLHRPEVGSPTKSSRCTPTPVGGAPSRRCFELQAPTGLSAARSGRTGSAR